MRDGLPVFDPACTTVERLEAGRSRWWTFAGVRANWLLANAVRQRGSSVRIDDFYIEMKGAIAVAAMRDRRRRKRREATGQYGGPTRSHPL